jgi:hypothetical protein
MYSYRNADLISNKQVCSSYLQVYENGQWKATCVSILLVVEWFIDWLTGYSATVCQLHRLYNIKSHGKMLMKDKDLDGGGHSMWRYYYPSIFLQSLRTTTKILSQVVWCLSQDFNSVPPKYVPADSLGVYVWVVSVSLVTYKCALHKKWILSGYVLVTKTAVVLM